MVLKPFTKSGSEGGLKIWQLLRGTLQHHSRLKREPGENTANASRAVFHPSPQTLPVRARDVGEVKLYCLGEVMPFREGIWMTSDDSLTDLNATPVHVLQAWVNRSTQRARMWQNDRHGFPSHLSTTMPQKKSEPDLRKGGVMHTFRTSDLERRWLRCELVLFPGPSLDE